jgi:vancomycin permeability regulator SanA
VIPDWIGVERRSMLSLIGSLMVAVILLAISVKKITRGWQSRLSATVLGGVAAISLTSAFGYYSALIRGDIHTWMPIPGSIVLTITFAWLALRTYRSEAETDPTRRAYIPAFGVSAIFALVCIPALRMITFGATRYERSADCAVVFGAAVFNDGSPSLALADRVDEAIRLYQRGKVKAILMSGAVDQGNGYSEPVVMMQRAVNAGVPRTSILLDEAGVNTAATVRDTAELARLAGWKSALVVTHYYHEPRAKMLFERSGLVTYTVPATMSRRLLGEPWYLVREVMAWYRSFLF